MVKHFGTIWVFSTAVFIVFTLLNPSHLSFSVEQQLTPEVDESYVLFSPRIVSCGEDLGDLFLASLGQRDTFFINLRQGDLFRIQMRFREEGPGEQIDLYSPNGSLLTSLTHTDPGAAVLEWPIDQLGVYTIVASAAGGNTTGFYGISFQNDNQPGCATIIDCDAESTSFFPLAGIEAYSVQADQNDSIRVQVQLVDPTATPLLQFFDPLGNLLLEREGTPGELLVLSYDNLPLSGNYMIQVTEANGGEGGVFGFSVQLIAQSCSIPVNCGDDISGQLANWGGMEAYRLSAEAGDNLLVQLRFGNTPPLLYLYQPDGLLLDSLIGNTGELGELFYEDLPMSGEYIIVATSKGMAAPGAFGISFQVLNAAGCSSPILDNVCEDSVFEQITEQAGIQAYTFEGEQDQFTAFQLTGANASFNGRIRIYDPTGKLIRSSDNTANPVEIVPFQLPMSGTYTILVDDAEGAYTGFFTLTGQLLGFIQPIDRTVGLCIGESVFAGGAEQTEPGIYYDIQPQDNDCDEVLVTEVVRTDQVQVNMIEAICFGDSLIVRGNTYKETGIYPISVPAEEGCDTLITLDLLLIEPVESVINDTICSGQIYTLGRVGYFEPGTYRDTLCDSIIFLTLTVLPIIETQIDTTICDGQWVEVKDVRYFETGSYSTILETVDGCDSMVNLNLTVNSLIETTIDTTICMGQWIEVNNVRYFETGNYSSLTETNTGCDSLVMLDLVVLPPIEQVIDTTICEGGWIEVNFVRYTESIQDTLLLETDQNCDSLVILDLTVLDTALTRLDITICEGSSYTVGNRTFDQAGEYVQVLGGANGCDSTVLLDLKVSNIVFNDINAELCQGAGFELNGAIYFETGFYADTIETATGCDSIIRLDLVVNDTFLTQIDTTICEGSIVTIGSNSYSSNGFYSDTLSTVDQCDSIIWLTLTVVEEERTALTSSICTGQTYNFGGVLLSEGGIYRDTLTSVVGCDSFIELDLSIIPPPLTTAQFSICEGQSLEINGVSYEVAGDYQDTLQTAAGCDSVLQFSLEVVSQLFSSIEVNICEGESYSFDGNTLFNSGDYEATFLSSAGCDSIVSLALTVFEEKDTLLIIDLCEGEVFSVGDSLYSTTGSYQNTLQTINNCDSTVNLELTVIPIEVNDIVAEICEGESYPLGGENYTVAGNYSSVLSSQSGCDSIVNLALSVNPIPAVTLNGDTELCTGETSVISISESYPAYQWSTGENTASIEASATDTYMLTVTDENGCEGKADISVQVSMLEGEITPQAFPNGFFISCPDATDGALEAIAFNGIAPYSWNWDTGADAPSISDLGPGTYTISVIDNFGCEATSSITLVAPPAFTLSTNILPPLCVDEGGIVDVLVEGETGPYRYEMGNSQQDIGFFEDVDSGPHTINVTDANGCQQSLSIDVPQAEFLIEQSFEQASITEGDSIPLLVSANFPIDKIVWEPARWLSCVDCPNPIARPEATTNYRATIFSESGCDLQAEFSIQVGPFNGFYIPNGFSPNGDGNNDTYFFQADHRVANIQEVLIFDRWGKLLFQRNNLLPNDSQLGWDGSYQGQTVQVGVYTYFVSIELQNGQTRTYKGDLTLLR